MNSIIRNKANTIMVERTGNNGGGGNRSMHEHIYPNGPYGPSGHLIPSSDMQIPKLGWGWTNSHGEEILEQHFDPDVQQHWAQYSNPVGTPYGGSFTNDLGQHVGYRHSSTTHTHGPRALRRRRRRNAVGIGGRRGY